jgi:1-acyl-sn-glycerol-3-phosphate acyltransferase
MLQKIKAAIKVSAVLFFIITFLVLSGGLGIFMKDHWRLTATRTQLISWYARLGLWILGIQVKITGADFPSRKGLIVCNHLSYTDVLVLGAHYPSSFVTSIEIKQTPFLGSLVTAAGCLFVERRNKDNLANEVQEITEALRRGFTVTIFPEATSTNGESVLRFRRPLYNASIMSQTPVRPMCINYRAMDGVPVTLQNRDHIFWYGDMGFVSHLWDLAQYNRIDVEIHVLEEIRPEPDTTADSLALLSHTKVAAVFAPCTA